MVSWSALRILRVQRWFCLGLALAGSLTVARETIANELRVPVGAMVRDAEGKSLGVFAGLATARDGSGAVRSAYVLVTPKGYIASVTPGGQLGFVRQLFFQVASCKGPPYLGLGSSGLPAGLPGIVFSAAHDQREYLVPAGSAPIEIQVHSRLVESPDGSLACEPGGGRMRAYKSSTNDPEVTGLSTRSLTPPITVAVDFGTAGSRRRHSEGREDDPKTASETSEAGPAPTDQGDARAEQCAEDCLTSDVGDGICDVACNNSRCRFDEGDCDGQCAPGCDPDDLGDGFCDEVCNTRECDYDEDDCE